MLGYFPQLLDDELVFSAVARLRTLTAYGSNHALQAEVYGGPQTTISTCLPLRLGYLVANLPDETALPTSVLIDHHTLFPYYAPFIRRQVYSRLRLSMQATAPRRMSFLGPLMSGISPIRLCSVCAKGDERSAGFMAWKRVHQAPGVILCPHHGCALHESPETDMMSAIGHYVPLTHDIIARARPVALPSHLDLVSWIARSSKWLLENPRASDALVTMQNRIRALLVGAGYATPNETRTMLIRRDLRARYGDDVLAYLGLALATNGSNTDWVASLTNRIHGYRPLRIIVLLHLCSVSIEAFFEIKPLAAPRRPQTKWPRSRSRREYLVAPQPAPCANHLCPSYKQAVLERLRAMHLPRGRHEIECRACRFRYSWLTNGAGRRTVLRTGPLWDKILKRLVRDRTVSLCQMERVLGMRRLTITRHAARIGVWRREWGSRAAARNRLLSNKIDQTRERHRRVLLNLRAKNPRLTRPELHRKALRSWVYLSLYDQPWLEKHLPPPRPPCTTVDWAERDATLMARAQTFVEEELATTNKPMRITPHVIFRSIGISKSIDRYGDRLPRLRSYASSVRESSLSFRRRRIAWAVSQLVETEKPVTRSTLRKLLPRAITQIAMVK